MVHALLLEFGAGTSIMILVGLWLMLTGIVFILEFYIFLIGVNYAPTLIYAIVIARKGSAKKAEYGLSHDKHYIRK